MARPSRFRISGTGCTLVDYLYKPVDFTAAGFEKYVSKTPGDGGLSPGKLVFQEEFDRYSGEDYFQVRDLLTKGQSPVAVNIGGPSIVPLIHAAQLLAGEPAEVRFFACRGQDPGGDFIEQKLAGTPLKTGKFKTGKRHTPFTDVLSDPDFDQGNGERIFINNIGSAWELVPGDLDDAFFHCEMTVFGGTALVPNIHKALGELVRKSRAAGAITIVNTVYDFLSEKQNPDKPWPLGQSLATYEYIDLLITDMEEALRLSGMTSVEAALAFFRSTGVGAVIITHGSNDLHYFSDNELFGRIPPSSLPVSERIRTELRTDTARAGDTTGCGDNFAGGVIASIARQRMANPLNPVDLSEAIMLGVVSGGYACFYYGGTFYEEHPGQKARLIEPYHADYRAQLEGGRSIIE